MLGTGCAPNVLQKRIEVISRDAVNYELSKMEIDWHLRNFFTWNFDWICVATSEQRPKSP